MTSEPTTRQRGPTRAEELRDELQRMIVDGDLAPGERLDEMMLARQFEVSRTPVREAIKALVATGLAEVRPRQGTMVSALTIPMLIEMFELMSALEGMCARMAARRATPEEIAAMADVQIRLQVAYDQQDPEAFYRINAEFHDILYAAAHSHFIADQTLALRLRLAPYRRRITYAPGRMRDTLSEHAEIMQAIRDGDADRAQKAAVEHVRLLGDHLADFISTLPKELLA